MTHELMAEIINIYEELKERKMDADEAASIFSDEWPGYREYHRTIGRSLGLEEAITLIEKNILKHWDIVPEDDYTEGSCP